jgi:hypothetical protein
VDRDAVNAPLPRERRARRVSLDGAWLVELEPGAEPRPIIVPFTFEAPLSGIGLGGEVHERLRYRRTFRVPTDWDGEHVLLRFGGVDWHAVVHVDGRRIGEHRGGYTHFSFDLGPLDPDVEHELVVDVHDPADGPQPRGKQRGSGGIWYTRTTGIWRPVWLEAAPAAHISSFDLWVRDDGTIAFDARTSAPTEVQLETGETGRLTDVVLTTASGDRVESYVGRPNPLPPFACGVLDQAYWPDGVYTAPSADALRADVEWVQRLGFDLARMHVKVADPRWYAWCDLLGLRVAQDIPSPLRLDTDEARVAFKREALEIVAQLRGHPCIAMWIAINEDWGEPPAELQLELARSIREADPGRLVVDASGWHHRGESDLVDVHDYGGDLSQHSGVWIGECGGVSLVVDGEEDFAYKNVADGAALADAYARHVATIGDVSGFVWTQLTDVEGELNGLLTHDRRPKADPEAIAAANDQAKARAFAASRSTDSSPTAPSGYHAAPAQGSPDPTSR